MDERAVLAACQQFRLNRDIKSARGPQGNQAGVGVGSSVEFYDYRNYIPGDDPRHVDWSVYARSEQLTVRRFREEINPRVDVLIDTSRSMGIDDGRKPELAKELVSYLLTAAKFDGGTTRLHLLGERYRRGASPIEIQFDATDSVLFSGPLSEQLAQRGMCFVISDFLANRSPVTVLRQLAQSTAQLVVVMLLGPWESQPPVGEVWQLVDAETGETLPLGATRRALQNYLRRLQSLRQEISELCTTTGSRFVEVCANDTLSNVLRRDFLPREVVYPQ